MDFKKKLKIRLFIAISYIILGVFMTLAFSIIKTESSFLSSFGFALIIIGIARTRNYFLITKNEETIKKQQILETDERNIAISNKAKSISFFVYLIFSCVSVILFEILNKTEIATIISGTVCIMLLIYWVSYFIISKNS